MTLPVMTMGERQDIPLPSGKFDVAIVLVGVSHPGNLGAICRSMLNYGFDELRLVRPQCDLEDGEAKARAKHASRVLDSASIHPTINDAATDCSVVVGTSGKREVGQKTLFRHFLFPWDFVERSNEAGGKVALIFGEEGKGLSAEDLGFCDYFVTLPTWEGYPIANLSHAVNAILYEIHRSRVLNSQGTDPGMPSIVPLKAQLSPEIRQAFIKAMHQFSYATSNHEDRKRSIEQSLKRTLLKGSPSDDEVTRIIGALVEATTALEFSKSDENWMKHHRRKLS
jgi:TrmH family RNA methyltransferase